MSIKFLIAYICDPKEKHTSNGLHQILALHTVTLPEICIEKTNIDEISSEDIIFGLDDIFNRLEGKKIYVSMDNAYSTNIYFDDTQWNTYSDVPKVLEGESIDKLNCKVVKFFFTNLIINKFDFVIHYNFEEKSYIPIFEHYKISSGEDIGILSNTKYKIQCIGFRDRNKHKYDLKNILSYLAECDYIGNGLTLLGNSIALIEADIIEDVIVPKQCKVVYIYTLFEKIILKNLVLPPNVEHVIQAGNFSFSLAELKLFISKNTNLKSLFGNVSYISNINKLKEYTGINIEDY